MWRKCLYHVQVIPSTHETCCRYIHVHVLHPYMYKKCFALQVTHPHMYHLQVFAPPTGTSLSYYKGEEEYSAGDAAIQRFNLTGAEAIPDVDVSKKKFAMNIILPSSDETGEIRLVFESVSNNSSTDDPLPVPEHTHLILYLLRVKQ